MLLPQTHGRFCFLASSDKRPSRFGFETTSIRPLVATFSRNTCPPRNARQLEEAKNNSGLKFVCCAVQKTYSLKSTNVLFTTALTMHLKMSSGCPYLVAFPVNIYILQSAACSTSRMRQLCRIARTPKGRG